MAVIVQNLITFQNSKDKKILNFESETVPVTLFMPDYCLTAGKEIK